MPNFMLDDVSGSLRAIYLLPLFVLIPGYTIAWLCDLFEFRRRTGSFRIALSIPLSIAVCPVVTYLLGRFGSMDAVWAFYWAAALGFAAIQVATLRGGGRMGFGLSKDLRVFGAILAAWLVISLFSLVDLQVGDRLYYPTSSLDNSVRTAFVNSISTTGIPPQNPFFQAGPPVALRYHYFWLMMCSLVERAGNHGVTPRQALVAGTFWCGVGLMALVALYLRLFSVGDPSRFRRRALTAVLLLCITGLDIVPSLFLLALYFKGTLPFVMPSVEWWNEHVDWFVYTALWAPHALASLLAGLTGFLLLWKAPDAKGAGGLLRYVLLAGVALASCVGASIYVSFVFAAFLTVWTGITVWKRWRRETVGLLVAGASCSLLALPYLLSLRGPAAAGFDSGPPIQFTVRAFSFAALVPTWHGMSSWMRLVLVNGPLIPMNYLLELGLFFVVGAMQWRKFRSRGSPLTRQELACSAMAATSILICTFLRSSVIGCNDLGWRGFLPAQFVLLLWAVDVVADRNVPGFLPPRQRQIVMAFLILGGAGTVYDLALTRTYPMLADRGVVPPLDWMSPDRQCGKRTYASRAAYSWAQSMTPETAIIQFNPRVVFQETPALLYSNRRTVAADTKCTTTFGGDPQACAPIVSRIEEIYPVKGQAAAPDLRDVCLNLPIDLIVVKDTDPVWKDGSSWVWKQKPVFGNPYVRLFSCGDAPAIASVIRRPAWPSP
jgi:hypothetical protein